MRSSLRKSRLPEGVLSSAESLRTASVSVLHLCKAGRLHEPHSTERRGSTTALPDRGKASAGKRQRTRNPLRKSPAKGCLSSSLPSAHSSRSPSSPPRVKGQTTGRDKEASAERLAADGSSAHGREAGRPRSAAVVSGVKTECNAEPPPPRLKKSAILWPISKESPQCPPASSQATKTQGSRGVLPTRRISVLTRRNTTRLRKPRVYQKNVS